MDVSTLLDSEFRSHAEVARRTVAAVGAAFDELVAACVTCVRSGGKVVFMGNGGSAADAQHLATELVVRFKSDRAAIAALALTTDTSLLTAAANDLGYDQVFSRQVEALVRANDVVIGISTSGTSENVLRALKMARRIGSKTVFFTGNGSDKLADVSDILLAVPSCETARIQEMHILIGHAMCEALETALCLTAGEL